VSEYADAYRDARTRVCALVADAGPDAFDAFAPAAPDWRARDVLAHLTGVCADITSGNLDGVATDAWTGAQVDARRDWTVERLVAEWDELGPAVEELIPAFPEPLAVQLLADTTTHEHDIRGALGMPGAHDSDALGLAFPGVARYGLTAALQLETEAGTVTTGDGEGTVLATVRAPRFELFRAMTGRRSADQIRAYEWDPEPHVEALVIGLFTPRPTQLVE
jgi:uncharacterized protein (TIGR03083 family)